ncbi:NACHT domain-containing protein [Streptomyces sioyaensis]|uniref:NACHT domain-containing protein n=1 Tax=Streptomyces sioyaensis TaxID=67364 RepID=UPI003EBE677D
MAERPAPRWHGRPAEKRITMQALWWATDAQRVRRLWWTAALVGTGLVQVAVVAFVDGKSAVERWTPALGVVVSVLGLLSTLTQSETRTGEGGGADWLKARADALAGAVEDMWAAEARLRRLQDPEPLPVRWRPVDMPLADHDENVWRRSEAHAALRRGQLSEVRAAFLSVPSRRVVVLGPPGSGKTVLALSLTLDLLATREPGDAVPVVLPAGTWDAVREPLRAWMAARIAADFPALAARVPGGGTLADALVAARLVVPVLDGFDELPEAQRIPAMRRLNAELDADSPLFLTSRTDAYAATVGAHDVLTAAAVVELSPLSSADAFAYLTRTSRPRRTPDGRVGTAWSATLDRLVATGGPPEHALREVLSRPLMVAVARAVYGDGARDPEELLDGRFSTAARIEEYLLAAFVPAVFGDTSGSRWTSAEAHRWLGFLARHMRHRGTGQLAWWELQRAVPRVLQLLAPGVLATCLSGVVAAGIMVLVAPDTVRDLWNSGELAELASNAGGIVAGFIVGLAVLTDRTGTAALRVLMAKAVLAAAVLGILIGVTAEPLYGASIANLGGAWLFRLLSGVLFGTAVSAVFAVAGVTARPAPLGLPWAGPTVARQVGVVAIVVLSGVAILVMDPFSPAGGAWRATAPAVVVCAAAVAVFRIRRGETRGTRYQGPNRRQVLRFCQGMVRGTTLCLLIGLALGPAIGVVMGTIIEWRAAPAWTVHADAVQNSPTGVRRVTTGAWTFTAHPNGTKTAEPTKPVRLVLMENTRNPDETWTYAPPGPGTTCREPDRRCSTRLARVQFTTRDGIWHVRMAGHDARDLTLLTSLHPPAAWWFWQIGRWGLVENCLKGGIASGIVLGLIGGCACGVYRWLDTPADLTRATSPPTSLRGDRLAVLTRGAAATIAGSAASALLLMTTPDRYGMHGMSLQMALVMGPLALSLSAYGRLAVARIWLGATGRLPWRLMAFLHEAHTRGVLRQSGARYEFRHLRLQECLAPTPESDGA